MPTVRRAAFENQSRIAERAVSRYLTYLHRFRFLLHSLRNNINHLRCRIRVEKPNYRFRHNVDLCKSIKNVKINRCR